MSACGLADGARNLKSESCVRSCVATKVDAMGIPRKKSPNVIDVRVGQKVRMRRMMLDMTQEKLGEALEITFQQVQKYEQGANRISASRLQHIANILQVPISFFFENEALSGSVGDERRSLDLHALFSTREGLDLANAFQKISDAKLRRRIVDLVEHLAEQ